MYGLRKSGVCARLVGSGKAEWSGSGGPRGATCAPGSNCAQRAQRPRERVAPRVIEVIRGAAARPRHQHAMDRIQAEFHDNQRAIIESVDHKRALHQTLDIDRATDILWTLNHRQPGTCSSPNEAGHQPTTNTGSPKPPAPNSSKPESARARGHMQAAAHASVTGGPTPNRTAAMPTTSRLARGSHSRHAHGPDSDRCGSVTSGRVCLRARGVRDRPIRYPT